MRNSGRTKYLSSSPHVTLRPEAGRGRVRPFVSLSGQGTGVLPSTTLEVDILLVAGGGAGGVFASNFNGGGGGAGGWYTYTETLSIPLLGTNPDTLLPNDPKYFYLVVQVGAGGPSARASGGASLVESSAGDYSAIALGGGGGGTGNGGTNGRNGLGGGCGGGGGGFSTGSAGGGATTQANPPSYNELTQGSSGGTGNGALGGGGGGTSSVGQSGTGGGAGGSGTSYWNFKFGQGGGANGAGSGAGYGAGGSGATSSQSFSTGTSGFCLIRYLSENIIAEGGDVIYREGGYMYHLFLSNGTFSLLRYAGVTA